jgi:hypothetical protein
MNAQGVLLCNGDKAVIVTGASQGIGAGLVKAFLERGCSVVATSRNMIKPNDFIASEKLALVDCGAHVRKMRCVQPLNEPPLPGNLKCIEPRTVPWSAPQRPSV